MSWEKCLTVIREMMTDRGYTIWEDVDPLVSICSKENDRVMIYSSKTEKFNIEGVKYTVFQLQQHRIRHAIIIYQNIITSSAKKAMEHLQDYVLEMFEKKELQFNPTRHRLFCPHIRLDKNSEEVPKDQISNLPVLLRTDVVAKYFHFHRGDIIRIQRHNGSLAYRVVK